MYLPACPLHVRPLFQTHCKTKHGRRFLESYASQTADNTFAEAWEVLAPNPRTFAGSPFIPEISSKVSTALPLHDQVTWRTRCRVFLAAPGALWSAKVWATPTPSPYSQSMLFIRLERKHFEGPSCSPVVHPARTSNSGSKSSRGKNFQVDKA